MEEIVRIEPEENCKTWATMGDFNVVRNSRNRTSINHYASSRREIENFSLGFSKLLQFEMI